LDRIKKTGSGRKRCSETHSSRSAKIRPDVHRSPAAIPAPSPKWWPSSLWNDGRDIGTYGNANGPAPAGSGTYVPQALEFRIERVLPARLRRRFGGPVRARSRLTAQGLRERRDNCRRRWASRNSLAQEMLFPRPGSRPWAVRSVPVVHCKSKDTSGVPHLLVDRLPCCRNTG